MSSEKTLIERIGWSESSQGAHVIWLVLSCSVSVICLRWLCWGLTSQSTIFQSCRDGAIASWVINQYFLGVKCLAQGHNTAEVGLEPRTSRSGVRHSTTEPPRSPCLRGKGFYCLTYHILIWASSWDYGSYHIGDQQMLRRACASTQSRQTLRCSHT